MNSKNDRKRSDFREPSVRDLMADDRLSRGEIALYLVLGGSVVMAFVQHVEVVHHFVEGMPEFAMAVATLVRNVV